MRTLPDECVPSLSLWVSTTSVPPNRMEDSIFPCLICGESAFDDEHNAASRNVVVTQLHASEGDMGVMTSITKKRNSTHEYAPFRGKKRKVSSIIGDKL